MSRSDEKGFTLIEILIAIVLFSVVLGAVYTLYSASQTTFARGRNKVDVQQSGRVAIGNVAREVRIAGYDPSIPDVITTLSTTAIETGGADTITFVADVDGDGATDRVTYRLQGTQIMRDFATWNGAAFPAPNTAVLADGVIALAFTYYDGSDNEIPAPVPLASLGILRRVKIEVTTQQAAGGQPVTFPLEMDVRLRNLS